jgi:hypothetical protein
MPRKLSMWTIYDHPADYCNGFIARRFEIGGGASEPVPTRDTLTASSLSELRAKLPLGLTRFIREAGDDPVIVETWL